MVNKIIIVIFLIFAIQVPVYSFISSDYGYTRNGGVKKIGINNPICLNYKTKAEIYEIRKRAVATSIFRKEGYEPSEEVFGQIVDGKPWISMFACYYPDTMQANIQGASEESRMILNPSILVSVEILFATYQCSYNPYENKESATMASAVNFYPSKNEIEVIYDTLSYKNIKGNSYYSLNGINARDLGYKYGYVDMERSTYKLDFVNEENIGNTIAEFENYIHLGGSCKVPGGCNNGSPYQGKLNFYYSKTEGVTDKYVYLKLWKNRPNSPSDSADIVQKIVFRYM